MNWDNRITKGKSSLTMAHPFFGSIVLQLSVEETTKYETMATDGKRLLVNPAFVDKKSDEDLEISLAHEVLHVALCHHIRMGNRDPEVWNESGDYQANAILRKHYKRLPEGFLYDPRYENMCAEEIYNERMKEKQKQQQQQNQNNNQQQQGKSGQSGQNSPGQKPSKNGSQSGQNSGQNPSQNNNSGQQNKASGNQQSGQNSGQQKDPGGGGIVIQPGNGSQSDLAQAQVDQNIMNQQAAMFAMAANAGNMPGNVAHILGMAKPMYDWKEVLRRFVSECTNKDYSYSRPNKQYLSEDMIVPGLVSDGINRIIFAIDTSMSINNALLNTFGAELIDAAQSVAIDNVTIMYADTKVHKVDEFTFGETITINAVGRGGTSFADTFNKINADYTDAALVIYFTDLDVIEFGKEPACPVMWATYGPLYKVEALAKKVPFGEVIHVM